MSSNLKCRKCGAGEDSTGLGWPSPTLCDKCAPKTAPCPFCGVWGAVFRIHDEEAKVFFLECALCHARGPQAPLQGLAEPWWNRRKEPIEPSELSTNTGS